MLPLRNVVLAGLILSMAACTPPAVATRGEGEGEGEGETPGCAPKACTGPFNVASVSDIEPLVGCTTATGPINLAAPDLVDLHALACLETVDGDFSVGGHVVRNETVHDAVTVGPTLLTSLAGLERLRVVTGTLSIGTRAEIFTGITPTGSVVVGLANLTDISALRGLHEVGTLHVGQLVRGNVQQRVTSTMTLAGLSPLDDLIVHQALILDELPNASLLPKLSIDPDATVNMHNTGVTSLAGPSWPSSLAGVTVVGSPTTPAPTTLQGLAGVTHVGALSLTNTALTSLAGTEAITSLDDLQLSGNAQLHDLSALAATALHNVQLDVAQIDRAHALAATSASGIVNIRTDATALAHVQTVGSIQPTADATFVSLAGLGALQTATVGVTFPNIIDDDLSNLASLTSAGSLMVGGNLASLHGLHNGLTVGALQVVNTVRMPDLTGLEHVVIDTSLVGVGDVALAALTLNSNGGLTSLHGLENIVAALATANPPVNAAITGNPLLADCLVDALQAQIHAPNPTSGSNRPFCTCENDVATCPYDACPAGGFIFNGDVGGQQVDLDTLTCAQELEFTQAGATTLTLPALQTVFTMFIGTPTLLSISLPALEQATTINLVGDGTGAGPLPLQTISLPRLQNVSDLRIGGPNILMADLTRIDLSSLQHADFLRIDCRPQGLGPTPLSTLQLGHLQSVGVLHIDGCAELAQCAVEAALAGVTVTTSEVAGLNGTCTCDAQGQVVAGSCTP
jgi:hypothetical protein